jgi:type VI secretion system protein ImpL
MSWRRLPQPPAARLRALMLALTSRWLISLAGVLGAGLVLWFLGPLLELGEARPLETEGARLAAVMALMAVWGLVNQLRHVRDQQASQRLVTALIEAQGVVDLETGLGTALPRPGPTIAMPEAARPEPLLAEPVPSEPVLPEPPLPEPARSAATEAETPPDPESGAELDRLHSHFADALQRCGRRLGRRSLLRLPWYLVIGAPGAGKTSVLAAAGLSQPDGIDAPPHTGLAGTALCDWWFTEEAVLVDTAGRYTTHDSRAGQDRAGWHGLLELLRRHRPQQPLNGIVVVVSLADLIEQDALGRLMLAEALSRRLAEIDARLGLRVPVYLIFTKLDRLAGFAEFFDPLDPAERARAWGAGFRFPGEGGSGPRRFIDAFDDLVRRLSLRTPGRLLAEPEPARRVLIAGFGPQLASLRTVLADFVDLAIQAGAGALSLRGVHFTSARHQGALIDRLGDELEARFGLSLPLPAPPPPPDRPFFCHDLFHRVIFADAGLASHDPAASARRHRLHRLARLGLAAAAVLLATAWITDHLATRGRLQAQLAGLHEAGALLGDPDANGAAIDNPDPLPVLPVLDALHRHPANAGGRLRALRRLLLPRLTLRLERALVAADAPPEALFETLRVYLSLAGTEPPDRFPIARWFTLDWIAQLPGTEHESERRRLADHLGALLEGGFPPIVPSEPILKAARGRLAGWSPADLGLAQLAALPAAQSLPGWRLADQSGAAALALFTRASGRPIQEPVPGLYTAAGFHELVQPALERIAAELAAQGDTLGLPMDPEAVAARSRELRREIAARYLAQYARIWEEYLDDLALRPLPATPEAGAAALTLLSGPDSPMRSVLLAVLRQTQLVGGDARPLPLGTRFNQLLAAVAPGQEPLSSALAALPVLAAEAEPDRPQTEAFRRLRAAAAALPPPLGSWLAVLASLPPP